MSSRIALRECDPLRDALPVDVEVAAFFLKHAIAHGVRQEPARHFARGVYDRRQVRDRHLEGERHESRFGHCGRIARAHKHFEKNEKPHADGSKSFMMTPSIWFSVLRTQF